MMVVEASTMLNIPLELFGKMREFLALGKTGNVTLQIKEGVILGWSIEEFGRVRTRTLDSVTKKPIS